MTDPSATGPVLVGETDSGTTITAKGDFSAVECVCGEFYEFRYRFTKFKMTREIGGGKAAAMQCGPRFGLQSSGITRPATSK